MKKIENVILKENMIVELQSLAQAGLDVVVKNVIAVQDRENLI